MFAFISLKPVKTNRHVQPFSRKVDVYHRSVPLRGVSRRCSLDKAHSATLLPTARIPRRNGTVLTERSVPTRESYLLRDVQCDFLLRTNIQLSAVLCACGAGYESLSATFWYRIGI